MHIVRSFSYLKRTLLVGVITSVLAAGALMPLAQADAQQRDCDDNAVLRCGAYTTEEVNQKYDASPSAKTIYHHFDVSSVDVNNMSTTAKNGYVTPGGRVMLGDETVATDAVTVGRQNIAGSTAVTANGTTFYKRSTDVSLNNGKLEAYVVMKDGKFDFAIIKSCGNPVTGTPRVPEKPPVTPPAPTPTPPAPTPPAPTPPAPVPPAPVPQSTGQCVSLTLRPGESRTVTTTVTGSVTNATITGYAFDFGDGTQLVNVGLGSTGSPANISTASATATAATTGTSSATSAATSHQYAQDGNYTITGYVQVKYNDGRTEYVTGAPCKNSVSYNTPVTPVATPPAPTPPAPTPPAPLPNVGMNASESVSLAVVIGLISAMMYAFVTSLRLKKNTL